LLNDYGGVLDEKISLRRRMRIRRREHEAALPIQTRALLFHRPPARIVALVPDGGTVGLYHAVPPEAPTAAYARWFHEHGCRIALPWFASEQAAMEYRIWADPYDESLLEPGPFGALQPDADAEHVEPGLVILPLIAFTADGHRLGQGGGHYDRWHAAHPLVPAIGLAWDVQKVDSLPIEDHDHPLDAVITPTRLYEAA
jgi:5-formyltetrahydrofolate cyclo-ligase